MFFSSVRGRSYLLKNENTIQYIVHLLEREKEDTLARQNALGIYIYIYYYF